MTMIEIYKHALRDLREIASRQAVLLARETGEKRAEIRAKNVETNRKIKWLEKVIEAWGIAE